MRKLGVLLTCLTMLGCGIDDQDRCLDGYYFDPGAHQCRLVVEEVQCGDGGPEGFGAACLDQPDCAAFPGASVCQNMNPMNPEGYCSYLDCDAGSCPSCYQCCDCSTDEEIKPTVCLSDQDAELAVEYVGCVCD